MENDSVLRVEYLDRAITISPSDPFLIWSAVRICVDSAASLDCPLRDWERRLIAVDGQNSESWIRIAANRYARGDKDAALDALQLAATAAETRIFWTETIEMMERGMAAVGREYPYPERAVIAIGFAAMMVPAYGDITRMCDEQSSRSAEWAYACLAYGELAENQGKTEIGVSIGRSMQRLALEALGETDKAAEVQRRIDALRQGMLDWIKDYNPAIERFIFSSPTMFAAYLAAIRSEGEEAARRQLAAEFDRLLEQQPELVCGWKNGRGFDDNQNH